LTFTISQPSETHSAQACQISTQSGKLLLTYQIFQSDFKGDQASGRFSRYALAKLYQIRPGREHT